MNTKKLIDSIANSIITLFKRGILVKKNIVEFSESTLGITSNREIFDLLNDKDHEGLMDMIFFPDNEIRFSIEEYIPCKGLSLQLQSKITERIKNNISFVKIIFSNSEIFNLPLSHLMIEQFTSKLYLDKALTGIASIHDNDPLKKNLITKSKTMIRSRRFCLTEQIEKFMHRLLYCGIIEEKIKQDDFLHCLDIMITTFNKNRNEKNTYSLIREMKHQHEFDLRQAGRLDQDLIRYSMEILMSLRIRPAAINIDEVKNNIRLYEVISMAVYGKTISQNIKEESVGIENLLKM